MWAGIYWHNHLQKHSLPENSSICWKDWCWSWSSNTLATWCKQPTHLKRPWFWDRPGAEEGDDRGWDVWMASLTQWAWVWASSGWWWRTGKPGVLQFMALQRVRHALGTGQQQRQLTTAETVPSSHGPTALGQCLAHSGHSAHICWIKEWNVYDVSI